MDVSYPPPVDQLLALGDPEIEDWRDYRALGLSDEHAPVLIEVLQDARLSGGAQEPGEDDAPFWAPLHAWRALGQLRAEAAIDPLLRYLVNNPEDDWALSEGPEVLAMIGPAAIKPVRDALVRAAAEPNLIHVATLGSALREIAQGHPEWRDRAVEVLTEQLWEFARQSPAVNAEVVSSLVDLDATEAAPVIQAAFEADAVDETFYGDWEDVQVELGLLAERITPRPRYRGFGLDEPWLPRRARPAPPIPGSDSAGAKARERRKAQKKKSKRKRR